MNFCRSGRSVPTMRLLQQQCSYYRHRFFAAADGCCCCCCCCHAASRPFSSSSSNATSSSSSDVVPGPRLLRTSNRHRPRPSLLHLPGLRALPFWTKQTVAAHQHHQQAERTSNGNNNNNKTSNTTTTTVVAYQDATVTRVVRHLEQHCDTIRQEYQQVAHAVASDYQADTEHNKLHQGQWDWRSYMRQGRIEPNFLTHFPQTARILNELGSGTGSNEQQEDNGLLFDGTPFGYAFFSTLHPHSRIQAHCAPMNLRLRVHLPLVVPTTTPATTSTTTTSSGSNNNNHRPACGIRVGPVTREWRAGKALVLDDAFEHEVWNETDGERVLLLADVWHPDVTRREREEIRGMFRDAVAQGWLSS